MELSGLFIVLGLGVSGRGCIHSWEWGESPVTGVMYRDVGFDVEQKGEGTEHKLHENQLIIKFTVNLV